MTKALKHAKTHCGNDCGSCFLYFGCAARIGLGVVVFCLRSTMVLFELGLQVSVRCL